MAAIKKLFAPVNSEIASSEASVADNIEEGNEKIDATFKEPARDENRMEMLMVTWKQVTMMIAGSS